MRKWFVLSLLLFPAEGQKRNFKWEAELIWPRSRCAWWGVSDGTFIGWAWKIIFSERSKSSLSRNREIKLEIARNSAARFLPLSLLTHKKEIEKIYKWQMRCLHGNKTLLYFPCTACCDCLPECEEKVTKIHMATNIIHLFLFLLPAP